MDRKIRIIRAKPLGEKSERKPREGAPHRERTERTERPERVERAHRPERPERAERAERGDRGDRAERAPRKTSETRRGKPRTPRGGQRNSSSSRKKVYRPRHNDDNSVYVGNLSFRTTEMRLGRLFESYGDIKDVRIVEDDKERSRGFGYVEFEDNDAVEKALQADGSDLDGRKIKVAKVQRREGKNRKNGQKR